MAVQVCVGRIGGFCGSSSFSGSQNTFFEKAQKVGPGLTTSMLLTEVDRLKTAALSEGERNSTTNGETEHE
jgi:hypothetical protein